MDKGKLLQFLINARTKTYAGSSNKVTPAWPGGHQYEYSQDDYLYRDFYNMGNGIFMGLETVYFREKKREALSREKADAAMTGGGRPFKDKPIWSNCYYGNFKAMTEEEVDQILRQALIDNKDKARLWHNIKWEKDNFTYSCNSDSGSSLDEMSGSEEIYKGKTKVYFLFYAGGFIG